MKEFLERINFPREAVNEILTAYNALTGDADIYKKLSDTATKKEVALGQPLEFLNVRKC